jgi:hypothetical protein
MEAKTRSTSRWRDAAVRARRSTLKEAVQRSREESSTARVGGGGRVGGEAEEVRVRGAEGSFCLSVTASDGPARPGPGSAQSVPDRVRQISLPKRVVYSIFSYNTCPNTVVSRKN